LPLSWQHERTIGSFQLAKSITMSSEGDGVIYAIAVVGSCTGEAKI